MTVRRTASRTTRRAIKDLELHRRVDAIGGTVIPSTRRGKYHAVKTVYKGVTYDSAGEAEYAWRLDQKIATGEIVDWERPKPVVLVDAPRVRDRVTYRPDFWVVPAGPIRFGESHAYYVDFKGSRATETAVWKLKVKLWRQKVPFELRVAYPGGEEKVVATGEIAA